MNCTEFGMAINSPRLKRIVTHWQAIRGSRAMPAWQDIRPAGIKAELPIVWSYRYDALQQEFIGGLAGDAIQRLLGGKIKNERSADMYKMDYPRFLARAKRVLFGPALFLGRGLLFKERDRQCFGERVMLPFSNKSGQMDGILGATDYKFEILYKSGPEATDEVEEWSTL
jgi:hypothetical protein